MTMAINWILLPREARVKRNSLQSFVHLKMMLSWRLQVSVSAYQTD